MKPAPNTVSPHPYIGEQTAIETATVQLREAEAERARLSGELAKRDRAMTAARQRLDFLGTAAGLATSGDGDLREAAKVVIERDRGRSEAESALSQFDRDQGDLRQRGLQ